MGAASDNSVDGAILPGMADIFILGLPVVVREELLVNDSINIDVLQGFDGRSNEVGFMSFGVAEKEQKSSWDWSRDSLMERVFLVQSIVGLSSFSQGSPRITFSFPRFIT